MVDGWLQLQRSSFSSSHQDSRIKVLRQFFSFSLWRYLGRGLKGEWWFATIVQIVESELVSEAAMHAEIDLAPHYMHSYLAIQVKMTALQMVDGPLNDS